MPSGMAMLEERIRQLQQLESFVPDAAPAVAKAVKVEITQQIAAGLGPDGQPLIPTKKGEQPMRGAARTLKVRAVGEVVIASIDGHDALHHLGRARGGVRRPILPTSEIPDPMVKAITTVLDDRFKKTMGMR